MKLFVFAVWSALACAPIAVPTLLDAQPKVIEITQTVSPTLLIKGKAVAVEVNGKANPAFVAHLQKMIQQDATLKTYDLTGVQIAFKLTDKGQFVGQIIGIETNSENDAVLKTKLVKLLANHLKFQPAQLHGQAVRFEMRELIALGVKK